MQAIGGGDPPEDLVGGFRNTLELNWRARTRCTFLMTDSPCHGIQYHEYDFKDSLPKGDPSGIKIEDQIIEFACKRINFHAIKITKYTDKMYSILSK